MSLPRYITIVLSIASIEVSRTAIAAEPDDQRCAGELACVDKGECFSGEDGNCRGPLSPAEFKVALDLIILHHEAWRTRVATPEVLYFAGKMLFEAGDLIAARDLLLSIDGNPTLQVKRLADALLERINMAIALQEAAANSKRSAEETLEALVSGKVTLKIVTLEAPEQDHSKFGIEYALEWHRDRYGDEYRYYTAPRGQRFVVLPRVAISAPEEAKDPRLPQLGIYRLVGDQLTYLATMDWAFYEWENFATYLGNEPDVANSFATSGKVHFTLAALLPESQLEGSTVGVRILSNDTKYLKA